MNKIPDHKKQQQLRPYGQIPHLNSHQVGNSNTGQRIIEEIHKHHTRRIEDKEREQEVVEEHVEEIQPEIMPEPLLLFTPWSKELKRKEKKANPNQPIEIILPVRDGNLGPQIA